MSIGTGNIYLIFHQLTHYKVYCDRSVFKGGIGAAAVLYKGREPVKLLLYHLGPANEHTVYEAELTGMLLTFYLLHLLICCLTSTVIIGLDNQAAIFSLNNQKLKPAHYLLKPNSQCIRTPSIEARLHIM